MHDPKMLVLDLDGTTLTEDWAVTPEDIAAAHALQARGIPVTIATGRLFGGTRDAARSLGVRGSVAVMNGTELVDAETGEVVYGQYVHDTHRTALRKLLDHFGLAPILFGAERIEHDGRGAHLGRYLTTWTPDVLHHDDEVPHDAWIQSRLVAVCASGEEAAIQGVVERIGADFPDLRPAAFTTWTGHGFVELRAEGDDKGTAIERLAAERGFTAEQVVAVGDWRNDVPMLRRAGRSFAMRGADVQAIDAADEVLGAVRGQGGGVAEVARRVWGIEP